MLPVVLGLVGLLLGAAGEGLGWLVGALAGAAFGVAFETRREVQVVSKQLGDAREEIGRLAFELSRRVRFAESPPPTHQQQPALVSPPAEPQGAARPSIEQAPVRPNGVPEVDRGAAPAQEQSGAPAREQSAGPAIVSAPDQNVSRVDERYVGPAERAETVAPQVAVPDQSGPAVTPSLPSDNPLSLAQQWLFGGNTVVRAGLLVLMVGVVLLLKWAADNDLFPIEARLSVSALIGIVLLVFGYRARETKRGFGLTLQGGGIATLYLTTFFAYRFYEVIPSGFAFGVLAALALFTCLLSVLQNAQSLALIGLLGGYLAPMLASSGGGSHVGLFAYTALLNLVVLALVFLRGWVNVARLGFLFTFGFLVAWRVLRYEPSHLATTEPFVAIFFLTYLVVPILLARHAVSDKLSGLGILFGTPLATLGVQAALLHEEPLYMAVATVCLGLVYAAAASWALKRSGATRQLGVAFIAIAACLGTVAIPYALQTQSASGAAWAIEGAGIVWFGLRQRQKWTPVAGAVLQLLGFGLYLSSVQASLWLDGDDAWVPRVIQIWVGAWLQATAMYATGYLAHRLAKGTALGRVFQAGLILGAAAFLVGPVAPLQEYVSADDQAAALGVWVPLGAVLLDRIALGLRYPLGRLPALVLIAFVPVFLALCAVDSSHVFEGWQGPAWIVVATATYYVLRLVVSAHLPRLAWIYGVSTWWLCGVATVELGQLASDVWGLGDGWLHGLLLLPPALIVFLGSRVQMAGLSRCLGLQSAAPQAQHAALDAVVRLGVTPIALGMGVLALAQNAFVSGEVEPLPYLPLVNPLDIVQLCAFGALWGWTKRIRSERQERALVEIATAYSYGVFGLAFVWFNAMLARTVHHFAQVPFDADALFHSDTFQVTVSVTWAMVALSLMWWTSRIRWRTVWFVGATLLGATIVKLFLIDLSRLGSGAKILTFLAVGLLVLLIGYLSPVPPVANRESKSPGPQGEV